MSTNILTPAGNVFRKDTVTFVHIYDVLTHIGFTDYDADEILYDIGRNVTWGDAAYTLIGNNFALHLIQEAAVESDFRPETIAERFWEVVEKNTFIS